MSEDKGNAPSSSTAAVVLGIVPPLLILAWVYVLANWETHRPGDITPILATYGALLILTILVSFIVNLTSPIARTWKRAFYLTIPSILTIIILFIVSYLLPTTQDDFVYGGLWSKVYWFQAMLCCYSPMGFLLALGIACSGWLGARLNQNKGKFQQN